MADKKPLAWIGVFDGEPDPEFIWWDEAKARRWINTRPGVELAPLFLAPTLTDAEREAVEKAAAAYQRRMDDGVGLLDDGPAECGKIAATLRGLLERLK